MCSMSWHSFNYYINLKAKLSIIAICTIDLAQNSRDQSLFLTFQKHIHYLDQWHIRSVSSVLSSSSATHQEQCATLQHPFPVALLQNSSSEQDFPSECTFVVEELPLYLQHLSLGRWHGCQTRHTWIKSRSLNIDGSSVTYLLSIDSARCMELLES